MAICEKDVFSLCHQESILWGIWSFANQKDEKWYLTFWFACLWCWVKLGIFSCVHKLFYLFCELCVCSHLQPSSLTPSQCGACHFLSNSRAWCTLPFTTQVCLQFPEWEIGLHSSLLIPLSFGRDPSLCSICSTFQVLPTHSYISWLKVIWNYSHWAP